MWIVFWQRRPLVTQPYEVVLALIPESLFLKKCPAKVHVLKDLELFTNASANTHHSARKESNDPHTSEIGDVLQRAPVLRFSRIIFRWCRGFRAEALRLFRASLHEIHRDIPLPEGLDKDFPHCPSKVLVPRSDAKIFLDSGASVLRKVERLLLFFLAIQFVDLSIKSTCAIGQCNHLPPAAGAAVLVVGVRLVFHTLTLRKRDVHRTRRLALDLAAAHDARQPEGSARGQRCRGSCYFHDGGFP